MPMVPAVCSRLVLTAAGQQELAAAARAVRDRLADRLADWEDRDVAAFGQLVSRFNQGMSPGLSAG